jgi:hypothetical protein
MFRQTSLLESVPWIWTRSVCQKRGSEGGWNGEKANQNQVKPKQVTKPSGHHHVAKTCLTVTFAENIDSEFHAFTFADTEMICLIYVQIIASSEHTDTSCMQAGLQRDSLIATGDS